MSDNQTPNPYSAPGSDLASAPNPGGELATPVQRLVAIIIDGIIMMVIMVPVLLIFFGGWMAYAHALNDSIVTKFVAMTFGFVVYLAVNGMFLAQNGQTIGKKAMGIKIVRSDGSKADLARIILWRQLPTQAIQLIPILGGLLGLVDVLAIFRSSRQCFHDQIADTIVIKA